jgi:hypothetical protein
MFLRLLLIIAITASAVAQEATTAAPARLEGIVISSTDRQPLKKATVVVFLEDAGDSEQAESEKNTTTNDQGRFSIELKPGVYRVVGSRNGYLNQEYSGAEGNNNVPVSLTAGQTLSITVRLVPTAVVHGRVSDEEGEPLAGAVVNIARYSYLRGRRTLMPLVQEQTNDLGEFRISNLNPGSRFYVSARYSGAAPSKTGQTTQAYGTTYHPNSPDPAEATPITLGPGEEVRIDFQLVPRPAFAISGQVALDATEKVESVMVMLADSMWFGDGRHQAFVSDGKFRMEGVTSGEHTLVAVAIPEDRQAIMRGGMRSGSAKVTVANDDVDGVMISLMSGGSGDIKGRIVVNSPSKPDLTQLTVSLEPSRDEMQGGLVAAAMARMSGTAQVKGDGTFVIESVPAGEYNAAIYASSPEWRDFYPAAIEFNGRDALTSPMKVSGGGSLVVTASAEGGVITGTVTQDDGKPAAGASVVAVPSEQFRHRRDFYHDAIADQNGRYEIHGAAPGAYRVYAWDSAEAKEAVFDPDFLKRFAGRGTDLRVNAGGRHSLDLSVIDTGDEFDPLPGGFARGFTGFRGRRRFR